MPGLTPQQRLQSERELWRAGLGDVLDSVAVDDVQRLKAKAEDLKVELIRIQTPPEATWQVVIKPTSGGHSSIP